MGGGRLTCGFHSTLLLRMVSTALRMAAPSLTSNSVTPRSDPVLASSDVSAGLKRTQLIASHPHEKLHPPQKTTHALSVRTQYTPAVRVRTQDNDAKV